MRPGVQEALFFAFCFAAASVLPFMDKAAQVRFSDLGFGMPPLMLLALSAVAGMVALWSLRGERFFAPKQGTGIGAALRWGAALVVVAIVVDAIAPVIAPVPRAAAIVWPAAWLFHPAAAVVAVAMTQLVPLALVMALVGRPAVAIAAVATLAVLLEVLFGGAGATSRAAFPAAQAFALSLVGLALLRRYGIIGLLVLRLTFDLGWHVVWDAVRGQLLSAGY